jgi:hypothetical protein
MQGGAKVLAAGKAQLSPHLPGLLPMYAQMKQLRFKAAVKQALSTAIIVALVVSISGKWESLGVYGPAMNHFLATSVSVPYIPKRVQHH